MSLPKFTKESAQYARASLDGAIARMGPALRQATENDITIVRRFIAAAKTAAPKEAHPSQGALS